MTFNFEHLSFKMKMRDTVLKNDGIEADGRVIYWLVATGACTASHIKKNSVYNVTKNTAFQLSVNVTLITS
jgi:hypothetical protein